MSNPKSTSLYDPSQVRSRSGSFISDTTCSEVPASESDRAVGFTPVSPKAPTNGFQSLTEFVAAMNETEIPGPHLQMRVHEGKYLGQGAQFQVYGQRHGVSSAPFLIDQPYIDRRAKVWKRRYGSGDPIDLAIKRTIFKLPAYSGQEHTLGFGSSQQLHDFQLEVMALCRPLLRSHRNIVKLLAWGLDYDPKPSGQFVSPISPILIVEYANCSMRQLLARDVPVPVLVRQKLCFDVCNAVSALHQCGIVHGDIKTDNILIFPAEKAERHCVAKLSDFGLSVAEEQVKSSHPRSYHGLGTEGWQAPELTRAGNVVSVEDLPKCDLYSLGLVIWSVILGDGGCPLKGSADREKQALKVASSFVHAPDLPGLTRESLTEVLEKLLQEDPCKRVSSLKGICERLQVASDVCPTSVADEWVTLFRKPENKVQGQFEDYNSPNQTSMNIWLTPPTRQPTKNRDTITTSWNTVFDLFSGIEDGDRRILVELYQNGVYDILRRNPSNSDVVGSEFSGHDVLSLCFCRTLEVSFGDLHFLPPEVCLGRVASCLLVAARKGSIAARDLARHFTSALPPGAAVDSGCIEWAWQAVSHGSVLNWDLQMKDPQLFSKSWETFRKRGGFNTHYVHFPMEVQPPKLTSRGLLENPLQWLQTAYPLHHAAALGNAGTLQLLLEDGQHTDQLDARGETALMKACMAGSGECARLLLRYRASPALRSTSLGTVPLHWLFVFDESPTQMKELATALAGEDSENLKVVCNNVPALFYPFRWLSGTPLDWAVVSNNATAIRCLLDLGGDLNKVPDYFPEPVDRREWTDDEKQQGYESALVSYQIYVESGIQNHRNSTVLEQQRYHLHARRTSYRRSAALNDLQEQALSRFGSELNIAIGTKQTERAERLIEGGFDLNQFFPRANRKWHTTLSGAISSGASLQFIRRLLEGGANVHGNEHQPHRSAYIYPLTVAALMQDREIVRLLVEEYGADVNRRETNYVGDTEGPNGAQTAWVGTALQAAIMGPKEGFTLVQYLLSKGANVNATAGRYHSALNCAAIRNAPEIARLLLKSGANIHEAGGEYGSPLAAASHSGSLDIVQMLLALGADINAISGPEKLTPLLAALTPLSYPAEPAMALLLIDRGANIDICSDPPDRPPVNPLQAAVAAQAKPVVKRLLEMGADPGVIQGQNIRQAVLMGSVSILRLLVEKGLRIGPEEANTFLKLPRIEGYDKLRLFLMQFADERQSSPTVEGVSGYERLPKGVTWKTVEGVSLYERLMKEVAWKAAERGRLGN